MSNLGDMLKEARLKKGYTLDDIHNITKIQRRYLEAIETGNMDTLPGPFYARAFVKSYADAVGLAPESVMEHMQTETSIVPPVDQQFKTVRRRRRQVKPQFHMGNWISKALLYLFAVLILFVIYIAVSEFDKGPKSSMEQTPATVPGTTPVVKGDVNKPDKTAENTQKPAVTPPAVSPPQNQAKAAQVLTMTSQQGNVYQYEITGVTNLQVKITAAQNDCWLSVLKGGKDGQKLDELTLPKGSSKDWSFAGDEAWIRMGSAPDVQLEVNGTPLDTSKMTRSSQIVSIVIKK